MKQYKSILKLKETEEAIKLVKDSFEKKLASKLVLTRVSAPLFVKSGSGINDDLSGTEKKVSFEIKVDKSKVEVVFSLAKWKRMKLAEYCFEKGTGLYTDMNAIRPDEESLDSLHSVYVDQWDWEKSIGKEERSLKFLKDTVRKIYEAIKETEKEVHKKYSQIPVSLPEEIVFIHSEDLLKEFPQLKPRERERAAAKKHGAIFVIGIGGKLEDGTIHDARAPDYDDWTTETVDGKKGLNGDIIVYYPLLDCAFEISSMGIRVDKKALLKQLEISKASERKDLDWHKRLLGGEFPLSIGGGIGQSRLCMFLLKKAHIGEVQSSIWPEETLKECKLSGINLL